jgi:hypothetical protein
LQLLDAADRDYLKPGGFEQQASDFQKLSVQAAEG